MAIFALIILLVMTLALSFIPHSPLLRSRSVRRLGIGMSSQSSDFDVAMEDGDYEAAYRIMKRNPLVSVKKEYARLLLNNIKTLEDAVESKDKNALSPQNEASVFIYRRLERQKVLCGFNCVNDDYPDNTSEVTPAKLEEITGLSVTALTPKQRSTNWQLAGVGLCVAEYFLGTSLGIDPLYTLIPGTFFLFGLDQLTNRGAYFETIYTTLFPEYKKKVICHEAGHFLIAYLLGIPVRDCITNAMQAKKYPEIKGQAGTVFFDVKMAEELAANKITRRSLDRLSVVLMAGIAAEAVMFGVSEGGVADEQTLISSLSAVQPPWNILKIQGQARWAVLQAILLIKEHREAYDALVKALEEGKGVGDAVLAIEEHLPAELPSVKRYQSRVAKKKAQEQDGLLRFIQKMTWKVGGLENTSNPALKTEVKKEEEDPFTVSSSAPSPPVSRKESLEQFTKKMEMLEQALSTGDLDVKEATGGLWLNGLQSLEPSAEHALNITFPFPVSPSDEVVLPKPLEGYEESLLALAKADGLVAETDDSKTENVAEAANMTVPGLLLSHMGYQMRLVELEEQAHIQKISDIDARLREMKKSMSSPSA